MACGRICISPIINVESVPDSYGDWTPLNGCAEWDGLVTVHATRNGFELKLNFSLHPPLFGELTLTDHNGNTHTSGLPTILQRPHPDEPDMVADYLLAGVYVLRCDFDTCDDVRLDLDILDWYSID